MRSLLRFVGIAALIALSAFFSGTEISFASANARRLRKRGEEGDRLSRVAAYIAEHYEPALTTILIGNNLVNIAASSLATVVVLEWLGGDYAWLATVAMTILILIFGEVTPKIVAKQLAERFCTLAALPLRALMIALKPIVRAVMWTLEPISRRVEAHATRKQAFTEDELDTVIDMAEDEGVLDEERGELLHSAIDFADVRAYEVLTPRVDMDAIDLDDGWDAALASTHSRLPVYRGSPDNIVGILHVNRLLETLADGESPDIEHLMIKPLFVLKNTPLSDVLSRMKKDRCHMAIVNDEYGGTMGLLTMEDVLEQLVGDIWDETDEIEREFVELEPGVYEAGGDMRLQAFLERIDADEPDFDDDNATVGGWVIEMLGGYPRSGDSFVFHRYSIEVSEAEEHRVDRVVARRLPPLDA